MRPHPGPTSALGALVVAALAAFPAAAQQGPEPRLFISITGGVAFGGHLWTIDRQPVAILLDPGTEPQYDTLRLARRTVPGVTAGLTASLFRGPHLGLTAEALFVGLGSDSDCRMLAEDTTLDPQRRNGQLCDDIAAQGGSASTMSFVIGAAYRWFARAFASPYLRAQGGFTMRNSSVVEVAGLFRADGAAFNRTIVIDDSPTDLAPTLGVAAGIMIPLEPGYQVRVELRDQLVQFDQLTGPAEVGLAPQTQPFRHVPGLTVSLDIVLEQKRGRRY